MTIAHLPTVMADAKGVIFDLNGVLVVDEPLHEAAFSTALRLYDVALTHEMYVATILGRSDRDGVARLAALCDLPLPVETIVRAKERIYRKRLRTEGSRYVVAGAASLVEALVARGMRIALASAAPAKEVFMWLNLLNLRHGPKVFDPIFTSESTPGPKPSPAVYAAICDVWGASAHDCVVIDDHPENIAIAHALGMRTIAITSTLPVEAFRDAQVVAHALSQL